MSNIDNSKTTDGVTVKPKRKTVTSSAVKRRYRNKVYSTVRAELPKQLVTDFKESVAYHGDTIRQLMLKWVETYLEENPNITKDFDNNNI